MTFFIIVFKKNLLNRMLCPFLFIFFNLSESSYKLCNRRYSISVYGPVRITGVRGLVHRFAGLAFHAAVNAGASYMRDADVATFIYCIIIK